MYPYILTAKGITVYIENAPCFCANDHANFDNIIDAVKSQDEMKLQSLLIKKEAFKSFVQGSKLTIDNMDNIYFDQTPVPEYVAKTALRMQSQGFDVTPLTNFIENLMQNPVKSAIPELYQFLEAGSMPLTPDGHFLAYKLVRDDYKDIHSGTFDNSIGKICEMPLNECNTDRNQTCSTGLHFCSKEYLKSFGDKTSRLMVVKINPMDVVSIPNDYNNSKGRCRKYLVVDEIDNGRSEPEKVHEYEKESVKSADVAPDSEVSVPVGMKKCGKCGAIKSLDEFHKDSKSKTGVKAACKTCVNAAKRKKH